MFLFFLMQIIWCVFFLVKYMYQRWTHWHHVSWFFKSLCSSFSWTKSIVNLYMRILKKIHWKTQVICIAENIMVKNAFSIVKMISIAWFSQVWLHLKHLSTVIVYEFRCLGLVELRSDILLLSVKFTSNHYMYNVIEYLF